MSPRRSRRRSPRSAAPVDATAHTAVRACPEGAGAGLFATKPIAKGSVVAKMPRPRVVEDPRWIAAHRRGAPGADAAIEDATGTLRTSAGFGPYRDGYAKAPKWYRMNHADKPNAKPRRAGAGLEWVALKDIPAGHAVTWHYGQRDPAWPRKPYCTQLA